MPTPIHPQIEEARRLIKERYTRHGIESTLGQTNPYREGSDAAKFWQQGYDSKHCKDNHG